MLASWMAALVLAAALPVATPAAAGLCLGDPDAPTCGPEPDPCSITPRIDCHIPCTGHGDTQLLPPSVCGSEVPNGPCIGAVNSLVCDNPCLEGAASEACQPPGDACVSAINALVCENPCVTGEGDPGASECSTVCPPGSGGTCDPCSDSEEAKGPLEILCGDDLPEVCAPLPDTRCCLNSVGHEVTFRYQTNDDYSIFNVWILEEYTDGADGQKDIRIGWHMDLPQSDQAVSFFFKSDKVVEWGTLGPLNPVFGHVSQAAGTGKCGSILFATGGSTLQPALVNVTGHFSSVSASFTNAETETYTTETTASFSSTKTKTWDVNAKLTIKPKPGFELGGGVTKTKSETHSYSQGETVSFEEGGSVTTTPTEWPYVEGPWLVG